MTATTEKTEPASAAPKASDSTPSPFGSLARAMVRGFVRDRMALFFTFLFPLMFLFIFGLIFASPNASKTTIGVVGQGPVIETLAKSGAVDLKHIDTEDAALAQVKSGDLPAYVAEDGDSLTLRYAASDQTRAGTVLGLVGGVVSEQNVAATGQPPRFQLAASQVEDSSLKPIQYLTPGLLSWSASIAAVFGSALTFVSWRKKQVLRRLWLAPVGPVTVLGSRIVVTLGIALAQAAVFIGLAVLPLFGLKLSGQWYLALILLLLGAFAFFSIGMLVGAFCKTEEAASGAANLITLPMAFLSGTFFPVDNLPKWLQAVSEVFPMRHLTTGMTDVMVRGKGFSALLVPGAVLIGFTLVFGLLAARVFRWED